MNTPPSRILLGDFEEIITEFEALQQKLGFRTDMPSNLLQTIAITTLVGMMGVTNAIIQGSDEIPSDQKWRHIFTPKVDFTVMELYKAEYTSFFVDLLNAIELAFTNLCEENNWEVKSITKENEIKSIKALERKLPRLEGEALEAFNHYKDKIINKEVKFTFNDYFSRILKYGCFSPEDSTKWEKFFGALTILRNKAAHSDSSLTEKETKRLIDAGLEYVLWEVTNGEEKGVSLGLEPKALIRIANTVDEFFVILYTKGLSKDVPGLGWSGSVEGIILPTDVTPDPE